MVHSLWHSRCGCTRLPVHPEEVGLFHSHTTKAGCTRVCLLTVHPEEVGLFHSHTTKAGCTRVCLLTVHPDALSCALCNGNNSILHTAGIPQGTASSNCIPQLRAPTARTPQLRAMLRAPTMAPAASWELAAEVQRQRVPQCVLLPRCAGRGSKGGWRAPGGLVLSCRKAKGGLLVATEAARR